MPIFYFVFSCLCLGYFVIMESHFSKRQRFFYKIINSFNFCMVALLSYLALEAPNKETFSYIMIALVLGAIGDVFLGLQHVYPQQRTKFFIFGFLSFLGGHIVYLLYFFHIEPVTIIVPIIMSVLISLAYLGLKLLKIRFGKYTILIFVYLILITFIVSSALARVVTERKIDHVIFFLGILLFFGSDCLLSILYFDKPQNTRILKFINSSLYFSGQLLIAFSIYFQ